MQAATMECGLKTKNLPEQSYTYIMEQSWYQLVLNLKMANDFDQPIDDFKEYKFGLLYKIEGLDFDSR
jgi:hypothetical protein